jgi:phosphotransferase system  glucose/maltose/N-acetylglucosamine-specific IIC component
VRALTILTSGLMVFIGVAIVVRTVAEGGGPAALGVIVGLLFVAAGAGRLWATGALQRHRDEDRER